MSIGALVALPELTAEGPARLLASRAGLVSLRFLASGAEVQREAREVVRYALLPGTEVTIRVAQTETLAQVSEVIPPQGGGLVGYRCTIADGSTVQVDEAAVLAVPQPQDPWRQLSTVAFHDLCPRFGRAGAPRPSEPHGPLAFRAREQLLAWRDAAWHETDGVVALSGARIVPMPHQLRVARRILADRQIRFLLADEVGLGKTIEAGLVVQSLLAMRPSLRVLIVVPGSLVGQWFLEMHVKFGGRPFVMLDSQRIDESRADPWQAAQVIVSSRALEELTVRQTAAFEAASWDVVVVDECHRMHPNGLLYHRMAALCARTPHVLLLSATPGRQHPEAYQALLHLLQPDAYARDGGAGWQERVAAQDRILDLLVASVAAHDAAARQDLAQRWLDQISDDQRLPALLKAWCAEGSTAATQALLLHVREQHRLDHRVIRNRRRVLAARGDGSGIALAVRECQWLPCEATAAEHRLREALAAYRSHLVASAAPGPRLLHWLLQLEQAAWAHPAVVQRLVDMRRAILDDPAEFAEYALRADPDETIATVLRSDLSSAETLTHIAISAAASLVADEGPQLQALAEAARSAARHQSPRTRVIADEIARFWRQRPDEKIIIFTTAAGAVAQIAAVMAKRFGADRVALFCAAQDEAEREAEARRFQTDDRCAILVSDPLGGEGRNFQCASVVAHHDLPWSVAAVEQRIGRVDRFGRDGVVLSWVPVDRDPQALNGAWAAVLDEAVGVFTASSSGLEFVSDRIEADGLGLVMQSGAEALRAAIPDLRALVEAERAADDRREDLLDDDGPLAANPVVRSRVPRDAVCRWLRTMGGGVRSDEDHRLFRLRPRGSETWIDGVFSPDLALRHHDQAFFAPGHGLVDDVIDDAARAAWCAASAWRCPLPPGRTARWEGVRVAYAITPSWEALLSVGVPIESLRRILRLVPLARPVDWLRLEDGAPEEDPDLLEWLSAGFNPHRGDRPISTRLSRDGWVRPLLGGAPQRISQWQARIAAVTHSAAQRIDQRRAIASAEILDACRPQLHAARDLVHDRAAAIARRLGPDHDDARRLRAEAEAESAEVAALEQAITAASWDVASVAYVLCA